MPTDFSKYSVSQLDNAIRTYNQQIREANRKLKSNLSNADRKKYVKQLASARENIARARQAHNIATGRLKL